MNVKKDKITDALDAFWGGGAETEVPSPQVDNTPEDIIESVPMDTQPQITESLESPSMTKPAENIGSGEKSIKEMIEEAKKRKQDKIVVPSQSESQSSMSQYPVKESSPKMGVQMKQAPLGGFAGFDSKIAQQFSQERGAGMNLGGPMSMAPSSKLEAQFQGGMSGTPMMGSGMLGMGFGGVPREDPRLRRKADIALDDYWKRKSLNRSAFATDIGIARSQEAARARVGKQLASSVAEQRNIAKFQSGMPVYDSWLDPLFGGKKKGYLKDPETNKYIFNKQGNPIPVAESTPGFFGLMAGGLNTISDFGVKKVAKPGIKKVVKPGIKKGKDILRDYNVDESRLYKSGKELNDFIRMKPYNPDKEIKNNGVKENEDSYESIYDNSFMDVPLEKAKDTDYIDMFGKDHKDEIVGKYEAEEEDEMAEGVSKALDDEDSPFTYKDPREDEEFIDEGPGFGEMGNPENIFLNKNEESAVSGALDDYYEDQEDLTNSEIFNDDKEIDNAMIDALETYPDEFEKNDQDEIEEEK